MIRVEKSNTGSLEGLASMQVNHTEKKCSFISSFLFLFFFFLFVSRYLFEQYGRQDSVIVTEIRYGLVS